MDGTINATGDVALIGTRDVTFTNVPGSPLSFTINEGVRVDLSDVGVQVTGSVTGANVGVAAGGQRVGPTQLTATILDIDPGATLTATAANGSIILATATEAGMTITNTPAASETIISEGALSATGVGGDVIVRSAEGISMAGGSVAANGGDVTLRTTAGQISANGGFAISGQNVLINSPSTITFNASTSIGSAGTPVNNVEVVATGAVTLGDVFANSLVSQGLGVLTETQLTLGNIRTTQALDVSTTAGALTFASLESTTGSVTVNSGAGNVVGGDIDAATSVEVDGAQIGLGTVNAVTDIDADAAAGSLTFAALNTTTGNVTGTATGAILGNGNVAATAGTVALTGTSLDVGAIAGTQVDLLANGAAGDIAFASINAGAGAGTVTLDANDGEIVGDVGNGDITGGAVFLAAGAGGNSNDISVGDVVASSLANTILGPELAAPNLTLGNVTVDTALTLIASDGDLNAGTIRTNGTNIALTAFDSGGGNAQGDVLIAGAITSLAGPALTGSIGIYAEGDVGVNIGGSGPPPPGTPIPEGVAILEAGEDIFVLSDDGNIFLNSVTAGDDIVLTALDNSEGRVSFESALTTGQNVDVGIVVAGVAPGAANSIVFTAPESVALTGSNTVVNADKQFVGSVSTVNFVENTLGDPAVYKGDIIATGFIQISAPSIVLGKNNEAHTFSAGDFIDISATTGNLSYAGDVTLISNTNPVVNGPGPLFDGIRLTAAGAIAGIDANDTIALQAGTVGNLQPIFVQAGLVDLVSGATITSASGLFLDFDAPTITLGMAGDTTAFQAAETININTSVGDLLFAGNVTLTSNTDAVIGIALDGITLDAAGDIGPVAGGSVTLLGGVPGSRTAVTAVVGGNFAATTINAASLSVTDGVLATAPGAITIGSVTTEDALLLRSTGGNINVNVASVTNAANVLLLAAGGGNDVISGTSLTTNGGAILLSAADDVDVNLVDNGGGAAIGIASGGDTLIGSGIVSGDDIVIQAGGNVGAPGALVDLSAGDDIRVTATGTIFLDSAVTDGTGSDGLELTITNAGTENFGGLLPD